MSVSGLTCCPQRISPRSSITTDRESIPVSRRFLTSRHSQISGERGKLAFAFGRKFLEGSVHRHSYQHVQRKFRHTMRASMDSSFGNMADDTNVIFPGINIRDPYRRLGISREASEEEIQAARNFLILKYVAHKPSVDAIESAHDKIIMQKFYERKNPKINIKKKVREVTQSRFVKAVTSRFETPSQIHLIKTTAAYLILGVLTVLFPTEEGPTVQVAISLIAAIYFIYDRLRSKLRAFLYGAGSFVFSWLLGTFMMISVIPSLIPGPRSLEVSTSLISYILLWVSSSYLK